MPFNPREITPEASINRVRIVDLPGVPLRDDERGKSAYDLLGLRAIYNLIRARADELKLPQPLSETPDSEIMKAFRRCTFAPDEDVKAVALEIRAQVHRRLAILLAVLRRGDEINREARPEWDDSYWAYWRTVPRIVVSGGTLMPFYRRLSQEVPRYLREFGISDLEVIVPAERDTIDPLYLPLIGAACCAPYTAHSIAVFDFGGTSVKSGQTMHALEYDPEIPSMLSHLYRITQTPSLLGNPYSPAHTHDEKALFASMVERIASPILAAPSGMPIDHAVVSVASYISPQGHPYPNSTGGYAAMQSLTPNLQAALAEAVSEQVGHPIGLRLIHDGTAAATAYPGATVLVFGTAIGVGTHPAVERPCFISHFLSLQDD